MVRRIKKTKNPSSIVENALLRISILGLLSLIFVQFFLSNHSMRTIIGNSSDGVVSIEKSTIYNPEGWIELGIKNFEQYENLSILKNGTEVKNILPEGDIINITVHDGDVIEVDAMDYKDSIDIKLHDTSENINNLQIGQKFKSHQNIVYLFKVKIDSKNNS